MSDVTGNTEQFNKLIESITEVLNKNSESTNDKINTIELQLVELLAHMSEVKVQLNRIATSGGGSKQTKGKASSSVTTPATNVINGVKRPAANSMLYFKEKYQSDDDYRKATDEWIQENEAARKIFEERTDKDNPSNKPYITAMAKANNEIEKIKAISIRAAWPAIKQSEGIWYNNIMDEFQQRKRDWEKVSRPDTETTEG